MEQKLTTILENHFGAGIDRCTDAQLFEGLMILTQNELESRPRLRGNKKLYYISAEFLIGKLLSNNLINLGLYDEIKAILEKNGKDICRIEEFEHEASLGNGGLGRLAACFLDSITSLSLPGDGIGLNYHMGLFEQKFIENRQKEHKNPWITPTSWLLRRNISFEVPFRFGTLKSVMYDIDVPGYEVAGTNRLHLFDLDSIDDSLVGDDSIDFDKNDIQKNLTLFLYPDDSDRQGQLLRIYQQYFMVSSGAQLILKELKDAGHSIDQLPDKVVIQINDTHPSFIIPELIRLLLAEGICMDEAVSLVRQTCAYTNHTILAEALETWPRDYLMEVVPHLLPIIDELNNRVIKEFDNPKLAIIDSENKVHMANMDIHYGFSVNGVAALHTDILKNSELHDFYRLYPEKFNNKTNGITFRRWLLHANPKLAAFIQTRIGDGFKKDAEALEDLCALADTKEVLDEIGAIKWENKVQAAEYLCLTQNSVIDTKSIFDVQVKRLHEYKRQQMNALYAIYKYKKIKNGECPARPITMIFGAKAAPAYTIAQDIIHLILCLSELIRKDEEVAPYLNVVMIENYNVTKAEKIIPAADISEQISLASKEASGTGNMKFMLNGAVTLGTEDGANVEIAELVGKDNIYIFGKKPDEVIRLYAEQSYCARTYYEEDEMLRELVDFIVSDELAAVGDRDVLSRLHRELIDKDWFMTLPDTREYIETKERVFADYEDRDAWNRKCLMNIARAGFFSSDRTIREYNNDIWKLV